MKKMGTPSKSLTEKEEEIREEYLKTLGDLKFNSKPLIDVLTEVAEENKAYAPTIADCIVKQLEKVEDQLKLPILYLIDSIIKHVGKEYMELFCKDIPRLFTQVYIQGEETVRAKLSKLRFTWNNLLPVAVLSSLDKMIQVVNPNWPPAPQVHVNPKFVAISTNVTSANGVPTARIAPVSSELINAVKRVRDPRLRKIELQEQNKPVISNNSPSCVTKEAKIPPVLSTTAPQIDAKIDQKNDRRLPVGKSQQPSAPKIEHKEPVKKRIAVKVISSQDKSSRSSNSIGSSTTTTSTNNSTSVNKLIKEKITKVVTLAKKCPPSTSAAPATKASVGKKEENPNVSEMLKVLMRNEKDGNKEKKIEPRKYTKEERSKGLQAIAEYLIDNPDGDKILATMAETYPKIVPILISFMEKSRGDFATDEKKPESKKLAGRPVSAVKPSTTKRDKNTSPKTTPKSSPAPTPVAKIAPVSVPVSVPTCQIPLPPPTTGATTLTTAAIESAPVAATVAPIIASIPVPALPPVAPIQNDVPTSIATLADKLIPTTLPPISVTTSVTAPTESAARPTTPTNVISPALVSAASPVALIPPPAPIISSTAAASVEQKTQDVDYRQLFGFGILPVPAIVPEGEPEPVIEVSEDEEIIDVDALPIKPPQAQTTPSVSPIKTRKRKSSEKKRNYRNHKKRRTSTSSNEESDSSKCSSDNVVAAKRPISEVVKIAEEEERSRSPIDTKKVKPDDSFYSQTVAPTVEPDEEKPQPSNLIIMSVSESSRPKIDSPPMLAKFESNFGANFTVNNELSMSSIHTTPELPPTDMKLVDMIDDDPVRSINIDGVSREIRHYGSAAVVFMNWDDPRDISFFNGMRNVIIDDKFGIPCTLNAPEVETLVYGQKHRFRLGVPTRELYVDGIGYECYFGGPPIRIRLNYKTNYIKLEGPPPSVNIGSIKRLDLVAGRIQIIIDDQTKHPVYLDAKPQYFIVDNKPVTLLFIDGLKRVLINNVPFRTDFGGLSQSFKLMGKIHEFRLTVLPHGILPGISLSQMVVTKLPSPPPLPPQFQFSVSDNLPTPPMPPAALATAIAPPAMDLDPPPVTNPAPSGASGANSILENISIDELFQKLVASGIVPNVDNKREETSDTVKYVDFKKTDTLKQRQPAMIKILYSGTQCSSCGLRFPAEQTHKYNEHLDWHFRLNRKGKDGARTIHSRKWYYSRIDWIKFQEMEDNTDRGTSFFDNATEYTEEVLEDVPCIPAGSNQYAACELCRDRFEQFYNDESDEWQLKNAINVDDQIYHPICYSDHQKKLEQEKLLEEAAKETPIEDDPTVAEENPPEEPAETTAEKPEPVEQAPTDYDDDSDIEEVQLIEQPIEEIIINDENDDEESNLETLNTEEIIAAQQEIAVEEIPEECPRPVKIEVPDDSIVDISGTTGDLEPSYDELTEMVVDSPQTKSGHEGVVTMDGNIELMDSPAQILSGATKIKINISKNHIEDKAHSPRNEEAKSTTNDDSSKETVVESTETLYPIVSSLSDIEKLVPADQKIRIKDAKLNVYPAVTKGTEKSGLCTIM